MSGATTGDGALRASLPLRSNAGRPPTNRAVEITRQPLEFLVHELTGTCLKNLPEVLSTLREFGLELEEQESGGGFYRSRWLGTDGVTVKADNKAGSKEVHVRIPGQACETLGLVTLLSLVTLLELKPTRVDAAIDFCPFTPRDLFRHREEGNTRTHAQSHQFFASQEGDTFTLGSRTSAPYLPCYDKRGYTRTELELKRGHAKNFLAGLFRCATDKDISELFLGALRAFVEFVGYHQSGNSSRRPLLPFWRRFIKAAQKVRLAPERVQPTVESYVAQTPKQIAAMFHTFVSLLTQGRTRKADIAEIASFLYERGGGRLKTRHRLLIRQGRTIDPTFALSL